MMRAFAMITFVIDPLCALLLTLPWGTRGTPRDFRLTELISDWIASSL